MIVKGCAGLGNRLISVLDAVNYSMRNNRKLVVDWSDGQFDEKFNNAFDKCFQLKDIVLHDINSIKDWDVRTHTSELFKANRNQGVYDLFVEKHSSLYGNLPMRLFPKGKLRKLKRRWEPINKKSLTTLLNFGSDLADGLTEDIVYYIDFLPQIDYSLMSNIIIPKPDIEQKTNTFADASNLNSLTGIHIRYTDKKPVKSLQTLINHLKAKQIDKLFLATDSAEIEKMFQEQFNNVVMFPKFKPELKNEGLHQWALYNNADTLKYRIYEESVIEMFLLSKCKILLYQGNSSFSNVSRVYHTNKHNCYDWQKLN